MECNLTEAIRLSARYIGLFNRDQDEMQPPPVLKLSAKVESFGGRDQILISPECDSQGVLRSGVGHPILKNDLP